MAQYPCLRKGDSDSYVGALQGLLQHKGYGPSCTSDPQGRTACDWEVGVYNEDVYQAVKEFQADKGLKVDGICGPDTWVALGMGREFTSPCRSRVWESISTALVPETDPDAPDSVEKAGRPAWFWPAVLAGTGLTIWGIYKAVNK